MSEAKQLIDDLLVFIADHPIVYYTIFAIVAFIIFKAIINSLKGHH